MVPNVRIIILNYNGQALLPECLPSIVEAAQKSRFKTGVTVLDNVSIDSGLDYVRSHFPAVHIEKAPANKILCSYNDYLPSVLEPVVILLNNDIRVDSDFVDSLVQKFVDDPQTFLAAPRVMSFDGSRIEAAKTKAGMRFGIFHSDARYPGYEKDAMMSSETFSSGFGAFSREKFLQLNGYDPRYAPGIYEDVDLCYRAQKAGYHLYYEPQSTVYHMGQASFSKAFGKNRISVIAHRNGFLFMWKNFTGFWFWLTHLFFLPFRLLYAILRGNFSFVRGFFEALNHTPSAK